MHRHISEDPPWRAPIFLLTCQSLRTLAELEKAPKCPQAEILPRKSPQKGVYKKKKNILVPYSSILILEHQSLILKPQSNKINLKVQNCDKSVRFFAKMSSMLENVIKRCLKDSFYRS
jgi:hypothetical protein